MNIALNDLLRVDGDMYRVVGCITYRNRDDGAVWNEYRLFAVQGGYEKWLSMDDQYGEYSISEMTNDRNIGTYHRVDKGTQEVIFASGDVDVDIGDTATFREYEDDTEEKTLSVEIWEDGTEYSRGYYLDLDEIQQMGSSNMSTSGFSSGSYTAKTPNNLTSIIIVSVMLIFFIGPIISNAMNNATPKIASYLKKSSGFTYETSISGSHKQKADVYKSAYSVDTTVKMIIDAIDGKTEHVQQNTEDDDTSVGILTKKEYCLVYTSEGDVLVQVSSRKYAYYNDSAPYRSTSRTHRYYRRFYRSTGYDTDYSDYSGNSSPYDSYNDTTIDTNGSDVYNSYSGSVRQASVSSRTSSGGGTSSGK